jgi:hypothetical protein
MDVRVDQILVLIIWACGVSNRYIDLASRLFNKSFNHT